MLMQQMEDWAREIETAVIHGDRIAVAEMLSVLFRDSTHLQIVFTACVLASKLSESLLQPLANIAEVISVENERLALQMARRCESKEAARGCLQQLSMMNRHHAFSQILLMQVHRKVAAYLIPLCEEAADSQIDEV